MKIVGWLTCLTMIVKIKYMYTFVFVSNCLLYILSVKVAQVASQLTRKPVWSDFDQSVAELRDWLTLLERMLKTQRVCVGDIQEIEMMIKKQKV